SVAADRARDRGPAGAVSPAGCRRVEHLSAGRRQPHLLNADEGGRGDAVGAHARPRHAGPDHARGRQRRPRIPGDGQHAAGGAAGAARRARGNAGALGVKSLVRTQSRRSEVNAKTRSDSGFALIVAILALMLLTFLGLTLAMTTSTELQIA